MKNNDQSLRHDIRGQLHALSAGMGALEANWDSDPELCHRLLPLMQERLLGLRDNITKLHSAPVQEEN